MQQLKAVHEIVRTGADGKREVVAPGRVFNAAGSEAAFLLKAGAARATGKPVTASIGAPSAAGRDLNTLKKAELVAIATELDVVAAAGMTMPQLIEAIQAEEEDSVI